MVEQRVAEQRVLGQRVNRVEGPDKVTGRTLYVADLQLPNMLHAKALRSPYAHARILRLDPTPALAYPGVAAVITSADFPNAARGPLAKEKAVFAGQPVAVVAADSPEQAEEGLKAIIVEYEALPPLLDGLEASKPVAPLLYPDLLAQSMAGPGDTPSNISFVHMLEGGDVDAAFAQADIIIEKTYRTEWVHQGYMEPRAAMAQVDHQGRITVWVSSQGTFSLRGEMAGLLGLPLNQIRVIPMEVGGGFGAKFMGLLEPLCIVLAQKTRRPVKMVMTRAEDLQAATPAPASIISIKMGATKDGTITAVEGDYLFEIGAFPGGFGCVVALGNSIGSYRIPNFRLKGRDVVVNKPPTGAYRAPSTPQAAFAVESHIDLLAQALNMDPLELRLRHIAEPGGQLPDGLPLPRVGMRQVLERVRQHPAWQSPLEGPNRGRGLACGLWVGPPGSYSARLSLNDDGTLTLVAGSIDISGTRTVFAQIVAEEFGVSPGEVNIVTGDTDTAAFSEVSGGSRIARLMGTAVYRACQAVKQELARRAAASLGVDVEAVEYVGRQLQVKGSPERAVSLAALAQQSLTSPAGPVIGAGTEVGSPDPGMAAHVVDVEVDPETGRVNILSYLSAQDVGFAMNPTLVEGQMQGAAAQGIGWALNEGYQFDEQGVLRNASLLDYRLCTALDLPFIQTILVEDVPSEGQFGAKGVGEPPIVPPLAAVANAIHRAIGVRLTELPMNPEAVWRAIESKKDN